MPMVGFMSGLNKLELPHNSPQLIRQELLDINTVRLVAAYAGLSQRDLSTILVAPSFNTNWLAVYQVGKNEKAFEIMSEHLRKYVRAREEGHTRAFAMAAYTNRIEVSTISDPGLRVLATNQAPLPLSWVKKEISGTITNKAGTLVSRSTTTTVVNGKKVTKETTHIPKVDEVCPWSSYIVVDGEICWRYIVQFKADGSLGHIYSSKCDAKEYDPKYAKILNEVETEVEAQMRKDGIYGRFGAVHVFWRLKKDKLAAKGIQWRSPKDLNPNTNFD